MKFVEEPKQRHFDEALKERAIEFHGHDGPFMVIGLRMGLTALERLDCKGWFDLHCTVRLHWAPPDSCVIDGIQSSTGCTMGKRNIDVVEQEGVEAVFKSKDRTLTLTLRREVLDRIKGDLDENEDILHDMVEELEVAEIGDIFKIVQG
ncbi:MAG: formylmethanofuran dehydrogenase subunit E family protein [Candidatus Bathyarchaeota archaeon]|nr:formylmethanofuran dehydrogenase subunit E family protein [Candidatus Bathyarchaeota archaeon]